MFPNKSPFSSASANPSFGIRNSTNAKPLGGQNQLFGKPPGSTFANLGPTMGPSLFSGSQLFQNNTPSFGAPPTSKLGFASSNELTNASKKTFGAGLFEGSAFGQQKKPGSFDFGATTAQPSLFGKIQTVPPLQSFGNGSITPQRSGTVIKFQSLVGTDTIPKGGLTTTIKTKHQCITCMKEYEGKSLEELRWEDYQANRKGSQQTSFGAALFSSTKPIFSQHQDSKPIISFGTSIGMDTQPSTSQNIFDKFATTTTTSAFSFRTNIMSNSLLSTPVSTQPAMLQKTTQTLFSPQQSSTHLDKPCFSFSPQQSNLFSVSKPLLTFGQKNTYATTSTFTEPTTSCNQISQTSLSLLDSGIGMVSKPENHTLQPQTFLTAPQRESRPLRLPSETRDDDYKIALNISDPFGQLIQLANVKLEDIPKRNTESLRVTKPEDIEKLLVRPAIVPTTNPMKSRVVPATLRMPSIFDGLEKEIASCSSCPVPRRRLLLSDKHKDRQVSLPFRYVGQEEEPSLNIKPSSQTIDNPLKSSAKRLDLTLKSNPDIAGPSKQPRAHSSVVLKRPQYYTIPSIEELEKLRGQDGKCYVQGFTVGRVGYGNVCFIDEMDVSNLNLDEIVHIRHMEITLYPDDSKKPPVGHGLNRRAQITLDNVYPVKSGKIIRNPDDALVMCFMDNLMDVCQRKNMRFFEYRPHTGSFVFEVQHF